MSQQYYAHDQYLSHGQHTNLHSITLNSTHMLIMTHDNSIELYQYAPKGITLFKTLRFHCNIKKLLVLPSKHHSSDYIFILDDRGRYAFWQIDGGFQLIQNHTKEQPQHLQLYKIYTHSHQQPEFCDQIHHFEVLDTKGSIFFNEAHEIVVLDYSIKLMGLKVDKPKRIKLDVIKYRFAGWVENIKHERWLALIEQVQEKTIMKVYNLDRLHRICKENEVCRYQKINLLQFASPTQNKLLVLTQNQVSLLQLPSMNVISTYNVRDTFGKLLVISPQIYGYLGEELILFSQTQMQSFGSLCLKDQNILAGKGIAEVRFLRELGDGGKLISIVTYTNEIYFVILYGNTWKLGHKMECMTPIFSLTPINNNTLLAVLNRGIDQYQVAVIEREVVVGFKKQQKFDSIIQKMVSINEGRALVVASKQRIAVLKEDNSSNEFQLTRITIAHQQLIAVKHNFIITTKAIYVIDTHNQIYQQLHAEQIVLAEISDKQAMFMNNELQVSRLDFDNKQMSHVRQGAASEYIWHLFDDTLIVGRSDNLQQLQLFKKSELTNKIKLQPSAIVSSMAHYISQQNINMLIVGFTAGYISIIDIQNCLILRKFENYANQSIQLQTIGDSLLVSSKQKHLMLNLQHGGSLTQISLASSEASIQSIAYLPHTHQIMIAENLSDESCSIVKTVSWQQMTSNEKAINRSSTYRKHSITSFSKQIPVVYTENNYIYVAVSKQILIYNASTRICSKIINNFYTDVIGIERIEYGILFYGIDQLSRNILTIIHPQTLQASPTISLILKDNKYIKSIKSLSAGSNRVLCRGQKYTTIYQISDTFEINEVNEFKTDFQGYSLDIDPTHQIFAITDSYRFAAFYTYKEGILPIARYVGQVEINDLCLIDRAVVVADRAGKIVVLEYNVQNEDPALKMMMTEVCSLNVGDQVCSLAKISQKEVIYATVSGKLGTIKIIGQPVFAALKRAENDFIEQRSRYREFDYNKWRNRVPEDKMIDCELVGQFLQQKQHRNANILHDPQFREISQFYQAIKTEMM